MTKSIASTELRSRRFGNRAVIEQPGVLVVGSNTIDGVIQDVGLRGAFFAAAKLPQIGQRGTLTRAGGKPISVEVIRHGDGNSPGCGLRFGA